MKCIEELKVFPYRLGIFLQTSDRKAKNIAIIKRCAVFITCISDSLALGYHLAFEDQAPRDRSRNLVIILASFLLVAWYSILIFQRETYETVVAELNSVIKKSESNFKHIMHEYMKNGVVYRWLRA